MPDIGKELLTSLLPQGDIWNPVSEGQLDQFYDAIGDAMNYIIGEVQKNASLRNPLETPILDDLEREFGIPKNDALTEEERREILADRKGSLNGNGNPEGLEKILQRIDPDLHVYQNSPAVDPQVFIDQGFLIINTGRGDVGSTIPEEDWPLVFFVGGDVTRDIDGSILTIQEVVLPIEKETLVTDPICGYKGLYTWCAAVMVVGIKSNLKDAVGNNICDANDNQIYCLFEWEEEGNWVDESGNTFVDDLGNNFIFNY